MMCPSRHQCINQVTPFKEEPGQSILQADSDKLSSFFTICKFYTDFQNKFWLWYTTALCLNNGATVQSFPLYKMHFEQNWSLPRRLIALANFVRGWRFNRSEIREWPKGSALWDVIRIEIQWSTFLTKTEWYFLNVLRRGLDFIWASWRWKTFFHHNFKILIWFEISILRSWPLLWQNCTPREIFFQTVFTSLHYCWSWAGTAILVSSDRSSYSDGGLRYIYIHPS